MAGKPRKAGSDSGKRYLVFHPEFKEDLRYWVSTDLRVAAKIQRLVENVVKDPFKGLGKPEPLKYLEPNTWSRRITLEHRLVYRVTENQIDFLQCRYHY